MSTIAWVTNIAFAIVGPAIVYALYSNRSKFIAFHAMQALLLGGVVLAASAVLMLFGFVTCGFGLFLAVPAVIVLGIGDLAISILYAIRASNGEWAEMPIIGRWARRILGP